VRGELDDALARMARMEELQRRLAAESTRDTGASVEQPHGNHPPVGQHYETRSPDTPVPLAAEPPHDPRSPMEPGRDAWSQVEPVRAAWSPVDDVVEAVRLVVEHHPPLAVTLWAEDGSTGAAVRVEWVDGVVTVTPDDEPAVAMPTAGAPPPSFPMAVQTPPAWAPPTEAGANDSAARLAELIRRDPSLLRAADDLP
jgi:hypothetical protein